MTTAHNIVPAPGPAFVRPSGGGGPHCHDQAMAGVGDAQG